MQSNDNAEKFITTKKIDSFEILAKFTADTEQKYGQLDSVHLSKGQKLSRLKELSKMYALYEPYRTTYASLNGSFRTRADSITGNRAERNGGRKKFNGNLIEIWV